MAIIGTFIATENAYGGSIETLTIRAGITFQPAPKKSDNAPFLSLLAQTGRSRKGDRCPRVSLPLLSTRIRFDDSPL
jgi:uncharacterized protein (DUF736 family)